VECFSGVTFTGTGCLYLQDKKIEAADSSEILEADHLNKWHQIPKCNNI